MCYSLGILVIGSLFWDEKDHRSKWRKKHLDMDNKIYVKVPIRYGRKSCLRNNTYTMVISNTCSSDKKIGKAIVVPCKKKITSGQDVIEEAIALWNAERNGKPNPHNEVSSSWGTVGLLKNPSKDYPSEIFSDWKKFYKPNEFRNVKFLMCEKRPISNNGILKISWPRQVSDNSPIDFDFILATVTAPTLRKKILHKRYPNPEEIAQEWINAHKNAHKEVDYYLNNLNYDIRTIHDKKILKELLKDLSMKSYINNKINVDEILSNKG